MLSIPGNSIGHTETPKQIFSIERKKNQFYYGNFVSSSASDFLLPFSTPQSSTFISSLVTFSCFHTTTGEVKFYLKPKETGVADSLDCLCNKRVQSVK